MKPKLIENFSVKEGVMERKVHLVTTKNSNILLGFSTISGE